MFFELFKKARGRAAIKKIAAPAFFEKQSMPKKMRMVRDNPCPFAHVG